MMQRIPRHLLGVQVKDSVPLKNKHCINTRFTKIEEAVVTVTVVTGVSRMALG